MYLLLCRMTFSIIREGPKHGTCEYGKPINSLNSCFVKCVQEEELTPISFLLK